MNKTLETINAVHGLNIKKEDFNSFKLIKPHFDKFLTIIIMDSPILVHNLENPDKYFNGNGVYPYLQTFYESFQLSDDGFDDVDVIKIARYCNLLQYVLGKIEPNNKMKFNLMDIVELKFSRLISFFSKLSLFAKFVLAIKDNILQVLRDCEIEKEENDKIISDFKLREQQALQNNYNYEELVENFQLLSSKLMNCNQKIANHSQILKDKISNNENISLEIAQENESLELLKENKLKALEEKNILQKYIVKHPKQLVEELSKLKEELRQESAKQQIIRQEITNLKNNKKQSEIISSKISLFGNHLNLIEEGMQNYEQCEHEILKMQKPEIELINHLVTNRENIIKEIDINKEKNLSRLEEINNLKTKNGNLAESLANVKEELKILKMREQETLKQIKYYENESLQNKDNFRQLEEKYISRKVEIDKNFDQSLHELKNNYSLKNNYC